MKLRVVSALSLLVAACEPIPSAPAPRCRAADASVSVPAPAAICAHLERIQCSIPNCSAAYERFREATSREEFQRLVLCYAAAQTCDEADQCAYACGADGGMVSLRAPSDAAVDGPRVDATVDIVPDDTSDELSSQSPPDATAAD